MTIISTTVGRNPSEEMEWPSWSTRVRNAVLGCNLKNNRMISVRFQDKPFNITVIQVYAPTSNAEEADVKQFYGNLQDLLELTPKKDVLFIIGDWNAKVGSQETPGVTVKFGLGIRNKAGQRLIEFCQENTLVIAYTFFQQHKRRLYTWTSPDGPSPSDSPITSWQIDGYTVATVATFILGGSKITACGDCSHEIKRCLLLGRKVITNLDSILKSRDITLSTNVHLVKAMAFPLVMYGCESWTVKKADCQRIDAFELWC